MSLPDEIIAVLVTFQPAFTSPTWRKALLLLTGTLLAQGRRTIAGALRYSGLSREPNFSCYHHVLNRAQWSCLDVSRRLLQLLVQRFVAAGGQLTIVVDEHLERRWGAKITKRAHYRDPLLSSKARSVSTSGLRWVVFALVVQPPWTERSWALPFLSILCTPPEITTQLGCRHKTTCDLAAQAVLLLRRWLPDVPIELVGDRGYSVIELGLRCQAQQVALITPLRLDANLFAPPPARQPGQKGRPRVVGKRLPKLNDVLVGPPTRSGKRAHCAGTAPGYTRSRGVAEPLCGITPATNRWLSAGCWCATQPGSMSRRRICVRTLSASHWTSC